MLKLMYRTVATKHIIAYDIKNMSMTHSLGKLNPAMSEIFKTDWKKKSVLDFTHELMSKKHVHFLGLKLSLNTNKLLTMSVYKRLLTKASAHT